MEVTEHVVDRVLRATQMSLHVRPARAQAVNAFSILAEAGDIGMGAAEVGMRGAPGRRRDAFNRGSDATAGAAGALARARTSAGGAAAAEACAPGVAAGAAIAVDGAAAGGRLEELPLPVQPATAKIRMNQDVDRTHFTPGGAHGNYGLASSGCQ